MWDFVDLKSGPGRIWVGGGRPTGPIPPSWLQAWYKYVMLKCKYPNNYNESTWRA